MSHTYYALYDKTSLDLQSISGAEFSNIPDGSMMCKVYEKDGHAFNSGTRLHKDYIVVVDQDGYAKFKYKYMHEIVSRPVVEDHIVQDLDYQTIFFNYLNIKFSQLDDEGILLEFDLDKLDEIYKENFKNSLRPNTVVDVFITRYQNTSQILQSYEIDLYKLYQKKSGILPYITSEKISLWASRK